MKLQSLYLIFYLYFRGCNPIKEIARGTEGAINPMYLGNLLFRLKRKGLVYRTEDGKWCLNDWIAEKIDMLKGGK